MPYVPSGMKRISNIWETVRAIELYDEIIQTGIHKATQDKIRKVSELLLSSVLKMKHTQLPIGNCVFILHVKKVFLK